MSIRRRRTRRLRKTKRAAAFVLGSSLLTTGVFMVAEASDENVGFKKRIYVGVGAGATKLEPETRHSSLKVDEKNDSGFHIAAGFDFNSRLSMEAYAADLGSAGITFLGAKVDDVDYQVFGLSALVYLYNSQSGLSGANSKGLARREGLSLYGRVGVGAVDAESDLDIKIDHDAHLALGLGAEYGFRNGFAVRGEYMALDTDMHYATVSLVKRFGKPATAAPLAAVAPPPKTRNVEIPDPVEKIVAELPYSTVNFAFDSSEISPRAAQLLDEMAVVLLESETNFALEGHTDWISTEKYNYDLSLRRVESVRRYLENKGVSRQRMETRGFGETRPVATNETIVGRAANRRVDVRLKK